MRSSFLFSGLRTREGRRGRLRGRGRSRVMRFESLEARQMLAADSGWQAATYSIADDAQAVPAMVAQQADPVETPAALNDPTSDGASQLLAQASELPPSDAIDTLRILKDIDAMRDGNAAAGLPEPGDETIDPFQLLGEGSSHPDLPGTSQGDDRGQMLDAMMGTFRGGASQGDPWSSPGESSAPPSQDPQRDPFARVGWARQDDEDDSVGGARDEWVDSEGATHIEAKTDTGDGVIVEHAVRRPGSPDWTVEADYYDADGELVDHSVGVYTESGKVIIEYWAEMSRHRVLRAQPDDGRQPNPADDSDGLGFLDSDPWALFLALYTGQTGGSRVKNPYDDDPGGDPSEAGYGSASAAPRVGLEAVINPGDSYFVTRPSGGGRDPSDGPIGPPEL